MSTAPRAGRFFRASRERLDLVRERRRQEGVEGPAATAAVAIPRRPDPSAHPLSFAQERLWFLDRFDPGNPAYTIPSSLRLRGRLDPAALARALAEVVRRHEALRATFHEEAGRPVQRVEPAGPVPLPWIDLSGLPPGRREAEAQGIAAREAARPFRLDRGPLLRARLLRLDREDHALAVDVHHIVADGWSLGVLARELTTFYGGGALPELPIQYADYAAWQRGWLAGEVLEGQLAWWRERLAGAPPSLGLPTDRPRPAVQTFRGGRATGTLPPELGDRLRRLAGEAGASLFMVLLAGFQLLLGRWSGQDDLVVGSPIAGRTRREVEGLIGLFLNHLALRADLSGAPSFRELLARVRDMAVGAFAHQDLPFEKLLAEIETRRDLSRTPLFQVFFNLLSFPAAEVRLPGLTVEGLGAPEPLSKFDLTLYLHEEGGAVRLDLVYNAALFDAPRMEEALAQYRLLLEQAVADPAAPAFALSLVTAAARRVLPDPGEPLDAGWPGSIPDAVLRHARETPGRPAVLWEGGRLTYGELAAEMERTASGLAAAGVRPGEVVAVWGHRAPGLVPALLGILHAGAAFVVLDPVYPAARNAEILRQAAPAAWLAVDGAPPVPGELGLGRAGAGALPSPGEGGLAEPGEGSRGGEGLSLAYIAFTSGSTGAPKGVLGLQRSLTHFYPWMREAFQLGPEDRFSLLSGLAHDPLQRDVFTPLWLGAAVAVPDPDRLGEPGWLAGWMDRLGVTVAHLTPAMGRLLTEPPAGPVPGLRRAFFVGEALTRRDVERLSALAPAVSVVNLYGSTETQRAVGFHRVEVDEAPETPEVYPLGRGMPGVQLLVLNRAGGLAGLGEAGEVSVRSPHLAAGYLGDPALTAARFVPAEGGRRYRTGDLGRYRPGGEVEPLGRADLQVKIRGFRVEPGEIEAALARHPAVREAVVVARGVRGERGESGDLRLVAYVVPAQAGPDPRVLRDHLRSLLPDYMVPSAFVALDALPLTPNRKVDRRALPAPPPAEGSEREDRADEAAGTPLEEVLAAIWREVLQVERIAPADDFFALGGHSLQVTRVLARVREAFGVALPVRAVFESPTLAGLASRLEAELRGGAASVLPPLVPRVALEPALREGDLPLSFAQERLWFLQRLAPGSAAYNMPAALHLDGGLDPGALARALREIVRRHEALRTTFPEVDGEPRQRVHPFRPFPVPVVDLRGLQGLPAAARRQEAERLARDEAARPFDLAAGPLLRAALVRLEEREWLALLCTHHIVSDGWSVGVLARETAALYAGAALPELPVQVADFAVWQRSWLRGDTLAAQVAWWRQALEGAPALLDLPLDRPRSFGSGPAGHTRLELPPPLAAALGGLARREGATLFMVLLAAFQALLHRLTGDDDLVVGSPVANRSHPGLEGLIGFFVNTLALRSRLDGPEGSDPAFRGLLARTRAAALGAYAHQDLPFEKLVEELRVERSLRHAPVFQVMLALQNAPAAPLELPGLTLAAVPLAPAAAKFDLSLSFVEAGEILRAALEHDARLFDATTAARLLGHLRVLLAAAAADPDLPLSALPLLGEAERHQVVVEWGEAAFLPPFALPAHRRFEEWAARAPEALAVGGDGVEITYGELDRAANRLAHALRAAGAGLETRVAVSLRAPEAWPLALLAVLKAGAAYLPLDPKLPAERRARLLADSAAALLLTEEALLSERSELPEAPRRVLCLDALPENLPDTPPGVEIPPAALAYVIYTSGSTGEPKGAGVAHEDLARHLAGHSSHLGLGPGDRLLGLYANGFDPSVEQALTALGSGAAFFPRGGQVWSAGELVERMERWGVTVAEMPTAYWRQVVTELAAAGRSLPPALRAVETGGEAMPLETAGHWPWVAPGAVLLNGYGPTETVITPTLHVVPAEPAATPSGTVPIGRPVAGRTARVVDRRGEPLPIGAAGELHLGGPLARGYLGRPDATAELFVPDPDPDPQTPPGSRVYRTGDRVRRLADGSLEFLGRLDRQLKIRGHRIEPGEVEAALAALPGVREAAVVAVGEGDACRLAAFLVGDGPPAESPAASSGLRGRLPEPMIPSSFTWLGALPLTSTGKVDRRALARRAAAETPQQRAEAGRVPPRDAVERELAGIWEELLGVSPVGVQDDFFSLGGHSLLAVRLASRIEVRFGRRLPIALLFERRTVESLAGWLRPSLPAAAASPLVRIQPGGERPPLFLVHPGGGGVLCYADLARALGPDQPLYGLQAPGLDGERPPLDRIAGAGGMADFYLQAVRAVQPAGPLHLGGWSFGGLVAYEMACLLAERGEEAGLVAVLDIPAREPGEGLGDEAELLVRGLDETLAGAVELSPDDLRGLDTSAQVALIAERARRAGRLLADFDERRAAGLVEVFKADLRAARAWNPRPYPGKVTVLRAAQGRRVGLDGGGWGDLAAEVDVGTVPGDHHRMVRPPHVEGLAAALRAALDRWEMSGCA